MECGTWSDVNLLSGLWDGLVAIVVLVIDAFWDLPMYEHCQDSWWYDLGFFIGVSFSVYIGLTRLWVFCALFVVLLICFVLWQLAGVLAIVVIVIAVTLGGAYLYRELRRIDLVEAILRRLGM